MKYMHPLAAPFYLTGKGENGKTACLLIHGYTGSPAHLLELGQALNQIGYTVKGILLPGHGTSVEEMEKTTHHDWLGFAESELKKLLSQYKKVIIIGISMGGLLGLILASRYPVAQAVILNAPLKFRKKEIYFTYLLQFFVRFHKITPPVERAGDNIEFDIGYRKRPMKTIPMLIKVAKLAKKELGKIKCPLLVVQSHLDGQVAPESGHIIIKQVQSANKELLLLENSKHLVTLGQEREAIKHKVLDFITQTENKGQN
ncbi:MAG: alpha/beta fold hydrolase [Spirochaetes bacterium]|nr:alpha/beta fold hydrolase [Spirochaetota bacterium]